MTPEGKVKATVRKFLRELGAYTFPVNQQGIGRCGIPDDYFIFRGKPSFIEFKASIRWDRNHKTALATMPAPLQIIEMDKARCAGMMTYVVDAGNMRAFMEELKQRGEYTHPWCMTWKDYQWYRDAPREFFDSQISVEMQANSKQNILPYETVVLMAHSFNYTYSFKEQIWHEI